MNGVLSLGLREGESFYVLADDKPSKRDTRFVIESIHGPTKFELKKMGNPIQVMVISDRRSVEIVNNVRVSSGVGGVDRSGDMIAKVAIQAPKRIRILRHVLREKEIREFGESE